jgi:hypothetical protein
VTLASLLILLCPFGIVAFIFPTSLMHFY